MPGKFCFACGQMIDARAEICPKCGVRQPGMSQWQMPAAPVPGDPGKALSTIAIVCGLLATLFFPIVLGPLGIILAAAAASRKEKWWKRALVVSVAGMLIGFVLGIYVATHLAT